jgi:flagellar L-ring protein precursor FlgH
MRLPPIASLIALAATLPLGACGAAMSALRPVNLTPMSYPAALIGEEQPILQAYSTREAAPPAASPNSLWRNGARTFFHDQRAARVGDILTVDVTISDSAQVTNDMSHERKTANNLNLSNLMGLESTLGKILPKSFNPASAIDVGADSASTGTGTINRQDQISMTVAAVVTKVLPNGNLVIQGKQEVKTNNEVRELTVSGIVRPEDISSTNTIKHSQIAEARISYAGRGDLTRAQKAPPGQALLETFSPF